MKKYFGVFLNYQDPSVTFVQKIAVFGRNFDPNRTLQLFYVETTALANAPQCLLHTAILIQFYHVSVAFFVKINKIMENQNNGKT